jgi:hypothetical protein
MFRLLVALLWLWQVKGAAHTFSCVTPRTKRIARDPVQGLKWAIMWLRLVVENGSRQRKTRHPKTKFDRGSFCFFPTMTRRLGTMVFGCLPAVSHAVTYHTPPIKMSVAIGML